MPQTKTIRAYHLTRQGKPAADASLTLTRSRQYDYKGSPFHWTGNGVVINHGEYKIAGSEWCVHIDGKRMGGAFRTLDAAISYHVRDHITTAADTVEQDAPACRLCGNHGNNYECTECGGAGEPLPQGRPRGRPTIPKSDRRGARSVKLSEPECAELAEGARVAGLSLADYVMTLHRAGI